MPGVTRYGPTTGANFAELYQLLISQIVEHITDPETAHLARDLGVDPAVEGETTLQDVLEALSTRLTDEATSRQAADALRILLTEKGAANGVATLGPDLKIPAAQVPNLTIGETFTVASQAAMLALDADRGDIAVRTDLNPDGVYWLGADDATVLANWVRIGAVDLTTDGPAATPSLRTLGHGAAQAFPGDANPAARIPAGTYVAGAVNKDIRDLLATPLDGDVAANTARIAAAIAAAPAGTRIHFPHEVAWAISDGIPVIGKPNLHLICHRGATPFTQQTLGKPVFDIYPDSPGCTVEGGYFEGPFEGNWHVGGSARGNSLAQLYAAVWSAADRTRVRDIRARNFHHAVYINSWDGSGDTHSGYNEGSSAENIECDGQSSGVLLSRTSGFVCRNIHGTYRNYPIAGGLGHLVYAAGGPHRDLQLSLIRGLWVGVTSKTYAGMSTNGTTTITVSDGDFGALHYGAKVVGTNIPGGAYVVDVLSPTQLVISSPATGTGSGLAVTVRCDASAVLSVKDTVGATISDLFGRDCPGLWSWGRNTTQVCEGIVLDGFVAENDITPTQAGALGETTSDSVECHIANGEIEMSGDQTAVQFRGIDSSLTNVHIRRNHNLTSNNAEVTYQGTRNRLSGVRCRNSGGGTNLGINVFGTDNYVGDIEGTSFNTWAVLIQSTALRTVVDIDPNRIRSVAGVGSFFIQNLGSESVCHRRPRRVFRTVTGAGTLVTADPTECDSVVGLIVAGGFSATVQNPRADYAGMRLLYIIRNLTTTGAVNVVWDSKFVLASAWGSIALDSSRSIEFECGAHVWADGVGNDTTTFTSATANFTTADVGRSIVGSTIPAGTTILARVSATEVTLSNAVPPGSSLRFSVVGRAERWRELWRSV